jgi:hypothetical protein
MASIGQTIAGPRFYETDEVWSRLFHCNSIILLTRLCSGSTDRKDIWTVLSLSSVGWQKLLNSFRGTVQVSDSMLSFRWSKYAHLLRMIRGRSRYRRVCADGRRLGIIGCRETAVAFFFGSGGSPAKRAGHSQCTIRAGYGHNHEHRWRFTPSLRNMPIVDTDIVNS